MTDVTTQKRLTIRTPANAQASLNLPYSQVPEVRRAFDAAGIPYWVSDSVISFDGGPEMAYLQFNWRADVAAAQALLDTLQ